MIIYYFFKLRHIMLGIFKETSYLHTFGKISISIFKKIKFWENYKIKAKKKHRHLECKSCYLKQFQNHNILRP